MCIRKNDIKKIIGAPIRIIRRYRAPGKLSVLTMHGNSKIRHIGEAIKDVLADNISTQERLAISSIEKRREYLLKSSKIIRIVDYGSGNPNSNRSKESMNKGVEFKKKLAEVTLASKSQFWSTILFKIIRNITPEVCFELGTCVGISASYQLSALNLNQKGKLITLEGALEIADIARDTLAPYSNNNVSVLGGPFHKTFKDALKTNGPVDFLFNDGHHDHEAVVSYFNDSIPYVTDDAVIVFDDISWSPGMKKAWIYIQNSKYVTASINLNSIGIVILNKNSLDQEKFHIPL
jgi:predicted O-methyltransferase YrrM